MLAARAHRKRLLLQPLAAGGHCAAQGLVPKLVLDVSGDSEGAARLGVALGAATPQPARHRSLPLCARRERAGKPAGAFGNTLGLAAVTTGAALTDTPGGDVFFVGEDSADPGGALAAEERAGAPAESASFSWEPETSASGERVFARVLDDGCKLTCAEAFGAAALLARCSWRLCGQAQLRSGRQSRCRGDSGARTRCRFTVARRGPGSWCPPKRGCQAERCSAARRRRCSWRSCWRRSLLWGG